MAQSVNARPKWHGGQQRTTKENDAQLTREKDGDQQKKFNRVIAA